MTYNQKLNKIINSINDKTTKSQADKLKKKLQKMILVAQHNEYHGRTASHAIKEDRIYRKLNKILTGGAYEDI